MLKRYQILLNDWQAEHYKVVSDKYDVSFSEMIRMALCLDMIYATTAAFPKYKVGIDGNILKKIIKTRKITKDMRLDEFHGFLSKVYFEARKAAEFWNNVYKD